MSLRELNLDISYNSDGDDILNNFYIPSLSQSVFYKRIGGYFSSSSFALAARGLSKFINQNGHMQLLVSHVLQKKDKEIIEKMYTDTDFFSKVLLESVNKWNLENEIIKNHVMAFGWMIANGLLDLKIAITTEFEIFHQKVGILIDNENNKLSFSGSNNETFSGWKTNIEEFKVFRSWILEQKNYLESDEEKFDNFWSGKSNRFVVVNAPNAVKEKLIKMAPKFLEDVKIDDGKINKIFVFEGLINNMNKSRNIDLHDFQKMAVKKWASNNYKGVLEMATGTGKTLTAFGCINQRFKVNKSSIIIIAAPQVHLVKQWQNELIKVVSNGGYEDFGFLQNINTNDILVLNGANHNWKRDLSNALIDFRSEIRENLIILTTHDTLASEFLINKLNNLPNVSIIIDEVHGIGAPKLRTALLESYIYRLGLSATPERWMDDEGTRCINDYFGKTIYQFTIEDAIKKINPKTGKPFLTPYNYLPYFVELTQEEKEDYIKLSKKIAKSFAINSNKENNSIYTSLLNKRANILKSAVNKEIVLEKILNDFKKSSGIKDILVYCNPGDQFKNSLEKLQNMKLKVEKFTNEETVTPDIRFNGLSEREYILKMFSDGFYQVLVAMKCLDEGVDIPSAKYGILMASSTNPREFIQRRGRLLRFYPGKDKAYIYDIIVVPPKIEEDEEIADLDRKIYEKEMQRYKEFAKIADNSGECLLKLIEIEKANNIYE